MAQIRSSRWWIGLTTVLAASFLGLIAFLILWDWPWGAGPKPEPSVVVVTASPTSSVISHPAPLASETLTLDVLDGVDEGWILVEYDSSAGRYGPPLVAVTPSPEAPGVEPEPAFVPGDGPAKWEIPGPRFLYAIDPSGAAFEAADLGVAGDLRLVVWLPDARTAIVEQPVNGGVALYAFDLISGSLSSRFPGPGGSGLGVWVDPEVRVSNDHEHLLIAHGDIEDGRGIDLIDVDGTFVAAPVGPTSLRAFVESADATILVTVEGAAGPDQRVVTYAAPGTSVFPQPSPQGSPSPSATASPSAAPSPSASPSSRYERVAHGMPPGEEDCVPAVWPEARQLLIACSHEDGTTLLYALAPMTSTFVDVATLSVEEGEPFLLFHPGGNRIARGSIVVNAVGQTVWSLPDGEPMPEGLVWAGEHLVSWGDSQRPAAPEHGFGSITVRHSSQGELVFVLDGNDGAAGFGRVVPAP